MDNKQDIPWVVMRPKSLVCSMCVRVCVLRGRERGLHDGVPVGNFVCVEKEVE